MIKLSVGLISGDLVWLALESLTRQITSFDWQLIISEPINKSQKELYISYIPKLKKANCVQIKIIPVNSYPKYRHRVFKPSSDILVIHEHDTYSHPTRLQEAIKVKHQVTYTDYQLSYSPGKKKFVQQTDRLNYTVNNKFSGTLTEINRDGFVIRKTSAPYLFQDNKVEEMVPELADQISKIKDVYSTVHFVYVYINCDHNQGGPMWRELYYSVKSIHKFFKGSPFKIFVVGDHPKIKGVTHIPCDRIKGKMNAKAFDATKKLLKIAYSKEINEDFIYMYDDIILLKTVTINDFTPIVAHDHVEDIKSYFGRGRKPSDEWIKPFNRTITKLKFCNLPTFNYETHLPRYFNKEKVEHIIKKFKLEDYVYMFSTLYFNTHYPKPDILIRGNMTIKADITIPYEDYHMDKYIKGRKFLNYNDMGLNKSLMKYIKNLFL